MALVITYHKHSRPRPPMIDLHAAIHTIVENQLAMELPPVQSALSRMLAEGLDRHDAIHAIANSRSNL